MTRQALRAFVVGLPPTDVFGDFPSNSRLATEGVK